MVWTRKKREAKKKVAAETTSSSETAPDPSPKPEGSTRKSRRFTDDPESKETAAAAMNRSPVSSKSQRTVTTIGNSTVTSTGNALSSHALARNESRRNAKSSERGNRKGVRFGSVVVHEHRIILGDNPSVLSGLPVTIDWKCLKSERFSVDDFESRSSKRAALRLPKETRANALRFLGYRQEKLINVSKEVSQIKARSKETLREVILLKRSKGTFMAAARELCRLEDLGRSEVAQYCAREDRKKRKAVKKSQSKKGSSRTSSRYTEFKKQITADAKILAARPKKSYQLDVKQAKEKSLEFGDYFKCLENSARFSKRTSCKVTN